LSLACLFCQSARAADGRLDIPDFRALEDKASEYVTVTLDAPLLKLATGFLDAQKAEDRAVKEMVEGLTGVYVKSFTFDSDFVYAKADVDRVRKQLTTPGWQRLVEVRSRKEQTDLDVYISMNQGKANGLAIIASEPRELTIVNIVGPVDLEKLHRLEGRLGVPKLQIDVQPGAAKGVD
jgi:hypothetical protein